MSFEFPRATFVEAILRELDSTPLVLVCAPRGGGKTGILERIARQRQQRSRHPRASMAVVQLEPVSSSPEMLHRELTRIAGPALGKAPGSSSSSSSSSFSFEGLLDALRRRPKDSFLFLDDVTELRTLSYYPSVEAPLETFLQALKERGRALLTSRFSYWMARQFPELPLRRLPPLSPVELAEAGVPEPRMVSLVSAGLAVHAARLGETLASGSRPPSIEEALAAELSSGGRIEAECRATLAELLHRARGYGACKSVLRVLAGEEGLKLTEVAHRLDRTAGSTRDYLRWLEEVDLIVARDKRFFYVDPLLRLWMRVYGRGRPPSEDDLRGEISLYLEGLVSVSVSASATLDTETKPEAEREDDHEPEPGFTLPPPPSEDFVEID